jgi:hypothetical protein
MHELEQETLTDSAIAIYIAIAPRDPREPNRESEPLIEYLEPVIASDFAAALQELAVPAQIIDGSHIGAPGWVIARTIGVGDGLAVRWAPEENSTRGEYPTLGFEDVAAHLAQRLDAACHIADHPNVPSTHAHLDGHVVDINQRSGAIIGQYRSTDGPLLANVLNDDIWFAHGTPWSIATTDSSEVMLDAILSWNPAKPSLLFERNGAWRRMTVMLRDFVGVHEWGPRWTNVDPRTNTTPELAHYLLDEDTDAAQFVFDFFATPHIDAHELAHQFDLDEVDTDRLQLVFSAADMDDPFTAISRILQLPEAAAEIAEGWRDIEHLPRAREIKFEKFSQAVWSSVTTPPTEADVSSRIMRLWLERPPAYYVLNGLELAAFTLLARAAHKRGRHKTSFALGTLAALTAADMLVPARWRGQHTRHNHSELDQTSQNHSELDHTEQGQTEQNHTDKDV